MYISYLIRKSQSLYACIFLYNVPSVTFNDFNYFAGMFLSRYERFRNEVEKK